MQTIYSFDLSKYIRRLTPPRYRNQFNLSWYETLLSPLDYSQQQFNDYKDLVLKELSYNGTTLQMERMLNDYFDPTSRRITITESATTTNYLFTEAEGQPPSYLFTETETGATKTYWSLEGENIGISAFDFYVNAPSSLSSMVDQINAQILKYKLAGVTYAINFS